MNIRKPSLRNNSFTECEMARGCAGLFFCVIPDLIGDLLEPNRYPEVRGEAVAEEQVGESAFE